MTGTRSEFPRETLLAWLGLARASALLLAQTTGVPDWAECAGWCVRAGEQLCAGGGAEVARGEASADEAAILRRHVVETLARVRAHCDVREVEEALRAADWAQGGAR